MLDIIEIGEVCRLLRVSVSTLEKLQRDPASGFPEPHRLFGIARKGRRRRWLRQDIMAFIERQARAARPVAAHQHAVAARLDRACLDAHAA